MNQSERKSKELAKAQSTLAKYADEAVKILAVATNSNVILVAKGRKEPLNLRITGDAVEVIQEPTDEGKIIEDLHMKTIISYLASPEYFRPWLVEFYPDYTYKCQTFGGRAIDAARSILGKELQDNAFIDEHGVISFRYEKRPSAIIISQVGNEIKGKVAGIMEDFFRTDAILKAAQEGEPK